MSYVWKGYACEVCGSSNANAFQFVRPACDYFPESKTFSLLCDEHVRGFKPRFHQMVDEASARMVAAITPDWMLT